MFNAFQWNCFNLVYTCNIALILFLKCQVTTFRIPPLVTKCHTLSTPSPLTWNVIYRWPLIIIIIFLVWIPFMLFWKRCEPVLNIWTPLHKSRHETERLLGKWQRCDFDLEATATVGYFNWNSCTWGDIRYYVSARRRRQPNPQA